MALRYGFFNSHLVGGDYDRKYNADDYSANMAAVFSNGVLRDGSNGFRVTSSGRVVTVQSGRAWIEGRWVHLDLPYTFDAVSTPVGDYSRIDAVILRLDKNDNARNVSLTYVTGAPAIAPVAPALVRSENIYELCLAKVVVNPGAETLTIEDCRADQALCGWVTSPIGYDEYFANLDAAFNDWFAARRNDLAVATLYKQYVWRTVLTETTDAVVFDIPQYDSTGVDIIQVFVNGLLEIEGVDYTRNGSVLTFSNGAKVASTEIVVICYKSIDGTGLGSVADEITKLQNAVAALDDFTNYNYICTGLNDNIKLSQIAQDFLSGGSDTKILTIKIYGDLGVTTAFGGDGSAASPFRWFSFGKDEWTTRKVIFDFCNTNAVYITCPDESYNILFYGRDVDVKNARIDIRTVGGSVVGFNSGGGRVYAEKCRFSLAGATNTYLAKLGTFTDCVADCVCTSAHAQVFNVGNVGVLQVRGGEYYARCATGYVSAPIYVAAAQPDAVVIADGCSLPSLESAGYVQTYGVCDVSQNGNSSYQNIITPLTNSAAGQALKVIAKQKTSLV